MAEGLKANAPPSDHSHNDMASPRMPSNAHVASLISRDAHAVTLISTPCVVRGDVHRAERRRTSRLRITRRGDGGADPQLKTSGVRSSRHHSTPTAGACLLLEDTEPAQRASDGGGRPAHRGLPSRFGSQVPYGRRRAEQRERGTRHPRTTPALRRSRKPTSYSPEGWWRARVAGSSSPLDVTAWTAPRSGAPSVAMVLPPALCRASPGSADNASLRTLRCPPPGGSR
jgi:hypothetical protein